MIRTAKSVRTPCEAEEEQELIGRPEALRIYRVRKSDRQPLVDFMVAALRDAGCRILHEPDASQAPFLIAFETPDKERIGIVAYAFYIGPRTETKNRPMDERSFQIKYGSKVLTPSGEPEQHELFRDPLDLLVTLLVGISPEEGFFVAADPAMHNPTKIFIRLEFKDHHVEAIQEEGWLAWERDHRGRNPEPIEVLVGGTRERFLDLILFERAAEGLAPGDRQLLAERLSAAPTLLPAGALVPASAVTTAEAADLARHPLIAELGLDPEQVLDLIAGAKRLKMAVRGWVAEEHLRRELVAMPDVTDCEFINGEGRPDLQLRWRAGPLLEVECKNVLRVTNKAGIPRIDFQKTRASKSDKSSRNYGPGDFDVVAGCLHAVTEKWEFRYIVPSALEPHKDHPGKLSSNVLVDGRWSADAGPVFDAANRIKAP